MDAPHRVNKAMRVYSVDIICKHTIYLAVTVAMITLIYNPMN
jgi:hypothetical protein